MQYRGSIARMGGKYILGIPKAFREAAGINLGDYIVATIEGDIESRVITAPPDLATALASAGLTDAFAAMSYTHQKEHVRAIDEAKAPETRIRRIGKAVEMVAAKKKN